MNYELIKVNISEFNSIDDKSKLIKSMLILKYRPHILVQNKSQELLGLIFIDSNTAHDQVINAPFEAIFGLAFAPEVDYSSLVNGTKFTLFEGNNKVGYGEIIDKWTSNELKVQLNPSIE